jgi:hypothetical protein
MFTRIATDSSPSKKTMVKHAVADVKAFFGFYKFVYPKKFLHTMMEN